MNINVLVNVPKLPQRLFFISSLDYCYMYPKNKTFQFGKVVEKLEKKSEEI